MTYGTTGSPGCCCPECTIYSDEFSSDTIGTDWTEVAGDWSIAAGTLAIADTSAILTADTAHPDGNDSSMVVRVDVRLAAADDRARVIVAYEDTDNYLFVEFWINSDGCGRIRAYVRDAGTTTAASDELGITVNLDLDAWHQLTVCYFSNSPDSTLGFRVRSSEGNIWGDTADVAPSISGDQAGLGTGATVSEAIEFDNFEFLYHHDEDHPNCPRCDADQNCVLHRDDFRRANNDNPGCAWEEVAGDWDIASNELTIATDDAILRNWTQHPQDDAHVLITFTFRADAGAALMVILDYEDDENFLYVLLEPGSHGDCGRVSFWRRTAGVDTQIGTSSLLLGMTDGSGNEHSVTVCWQDEGLRVSLDPASGSEYTSFTRHSVHGVEQVAAQPYVGFGTLSASQIWIDDFELQRLRDDDHPTCPECEEILCGIYNGDPRREPADDTIFNCLWTIEVGTWTVNETAGNPALILGGFDADDCYNELIEVTTSDAMLINESGHPGITAEGFLDLTSAVAVDVVSFDYGDIVRVLIGYQDANNYLYAEWEWAADDESEGTLRIGKVEAGVDTMIADELSSIVGGQPHLDADADQIGSLLKVCYDGLELRAAFVNGSQAVGGTFGATTYVSGDAGVGWNPGKSGLATGAIAASVYFSCFRFYHDIFGGNEDCAPCGLGITCGFCLDEFEVEQTPQVMLIQLSGIGLDPIETIFCPDHARYNDTFAAPLLIGDGNECTWQVKPHFCDSDVSPTLDASIRFRIQLGVPLGFGSGLVFRVVAIGYDPDEPAVPNNNGHSQVIWTNHYPTDTTVDCLSYFADWVTIGTFSIAATGWLGGTLGALTARVKVLL